MRSAESRAKTSAALRGHVVSAETRAKIAAKLRGRPLSAETKAKMSQRRLSHEHRQRIAAALTGIKRSDATRAKIRAVTLGHPPTAWARWPHGDHVFRSSYEVRVAKALTALGVEWQYEKHRFKVGESTYTPDFYLPSEGVFLEVKGWFSPKAREKVAAFRAQHPETPLIVVNKQAMEALEAAIARAA